MHKKIIAKIVIAPLLILTACAPNAPNSPSQAARDGSINTSKPETNYEKKSNLPPLEKRSKRITASGPEKRYEKGDAAEKYYNQGIDSASKKNHDFAIKNFDQAIMLRPDFPQAYFGRGLELCHLGDKEGGIKDFKRAIEIYKKQGTNRNVKDYHDVRIFLIDVEFAKRLEDDSKARQ